MFHLLRNARATSFNTAAYLLPIGRQDEMSSGDHVVMISYHRDKQGRPHLGNQPHTKQNQIVSAILLVEGRNCQNISFITKIEDESSVRRRGQ